MNTHQSDALTNNLDELGELSSPRSLFGIHPNFIDRAIVALERLANHFDPVPPEKVGTRYIADRLGCTTEYIAIMAKEGTIPPSCLVLGTGKGKQWKFHRTRIDKWIAER